MGGRIDPRILRRAAYKLALALATTVVALSGCGSSSSSSSSGSSSVPVATYVKSICTAVVPMEKDIQSKANTLALSGASSPTQKKQAFQSFFTSAVSDADQAVARLQAAGTPNVSNGQAIAAAVVKAFTQLKGIFVQAQTAVNALPTSSAAAFKLAGSRIAPAIQASLAGITSSLTPLKTPVLETAAKNEPACKSLGP